VSTHRSTWKRRERDAARVFGTKRQVLSGSSGCESNSDSCHPRLYLECKLRASSATRSLWELTKARAVKEGKIPVVLLYDKGKHGAIVAVHQDDLAAVAVELARQSDAGSTNPRPPGQSGPGALETPR
jgi:hypothetical protein